MFKKTILAAGLALAFCTAQAGDIIRIDPDGGGPNGIVNVGSLGWNNGNAISVPVSGGPLAPIPSVGAVLQTYGQGTLSNFNNAGGNSIGGTCLNVSCEWTYVFGFQEQVTGVTIAGGFPNVDFQSIAGGNNFFQIYYDPAGNSDNRAGTGFNDGILIASGTVLPFGSPNAPIGSGGSSFATTGTGGALDQFGTNDYPGITTTVGVGSSFFTAQVTGYNSAFFVTPPTLIQLSSNTFQNQPFGQQNPSSCFWNGSAFIGGAGPGNFGGTCANTIGAINGTTGPNIMFQTRATSDFTAVVPEPGSLALLGLGICLAAFSRRKTGQAS